MKSETVVPNSGSNGDEAAKLIKELRHAFEHHLRRTLAKDRYTATTPRPLLRLCSRRARPPD